jgi:nucleoside-diphosphate-sugar epimerase
MLNRVIREDLEFIVNHDLDWDKFDNSTILITGANGFLAAYIVETFLHLNDKYDKNIKVLALVRNRDNIQAKFSHHSGRDDLEFIIQDVCKPLKTDESIDYIIHLASQASFAHFESDPVGTLNANTIGTTNLLMLAYQKQVKDFLYFSSGAVLGVIPDDKIPAKETDYGYLDPTDIKSCYAESKRMAENICVSWNHQYEVPFKIIRPSYVYGPGMKTFNDDRIFPKFISNVISNKDIEIEDYNNKTRAFCYLADATIATFFILLKGENTNVYNVGIEDETSILDFANLIIEMYGDRGINLIKKEKTESLRYTDNIVQRSCFDISKLKQIGWYPRFDLKNGIKRTVEHYEESD